MFDLIRTHQAVFQRDCPVTFRPAASQARQHLVLSGFSLFIFGFVATILIDVLEDRRAPSLHFPGE